MAAPFLAGGQCASGWVRAAPPHTSLQPPPPGHQRQDLRTWSSVEKEVALCVGEMFCSLILLPVVSFLPT